MEPEKSNVIEPEKMSSASANCGPVGISVQTPSSDFYKALERICKTFLTAYVIKSLRDIGVAIVTKNKDNDNKSK